MTAQMFVFRFGLAGVRDPLKLVDPLGKSSLSGKAGTLENDNPFRRGLRVSDPTTMGSIDIQKQVKFNTLAQVALGWIH